ncbi:hypothetical protein SDJN02_21326, partial [Cucurbita argyrosperma subsp. argyrosperma]
MMTRTHYPFVDGAASTAKKLKLETETWIKSLVFCRQRCRTKEECEDTIRRNLRTPMMKFLMEHLEKSGCGIGDKFIKNSSHGRTSNLCVRSC